MELSCSCLYGSGLTTTRVSDNPVIVSEFETRLLLVMLPFFLFFLLFCIIEVFNVCFCYNWELVPFICCYCFCFFVLGNTPHMWKTPVTKNQAFVHIRSIGRYDSRGTTCHREIDKKRATGDLYLPASRAISRR